MKQPGVFLTADWRNLVMLNYAVDPDLLQRLVPSGTQLDVFEGQTYVSLVGFAGFSCLSVQSHQDPLSHSFINAECEAV